MPENPELVSVPQDLTLVSTEELQAIEANATAAFDRLSELDDVSPDALQQLTNLAEDIERLRAELQVREDRAAREAELARAKAAEERTRLAARVHGPAAATQNDGGNGGNAPASAEPEAVAAAAARGAVAGLVAALGGNDGRIDVSAITRRATATLADAQRYAPPVRVAERTLAVTAAVDIPGMDRSATLPNISALGNAFHRRARATAVTSAGEEAPRHLVASIRNEFEHTVDDRASLRDMQELISHLTRKDAQEALVAGGGWCAPSEIRYDFFNVGCVDGLIDLPTFGVSRGGIRWPISPSLADVFGGVTTTLTNATNPWLWTETDDIANVTGAPTKPCVRVPCPDFDEERLDCYGICLTAGNLTDDAYPEATENYLKLLTVAHQHAINGRLIATMASLSETCVTGGAFAAGGPAFNAIVSGLDLAATDTRERFVMCDDDVLEVVAPRWVSRVIRADLARRSNGSAETLSMTMAAINSHMADRNVRVQWVNDWQVRGANQFGHSSGRTSWPTSANFMVYPAGTFGRGNGLTLDLGVVRDSVLNADNDHTAAWTEECNLIAKFGHESRCYTIAFDVAGDTCCDDVTPPMA